MSRTNETKNMKWHEAWKCECRLDAIVCNDKQRWNNDKCWCQCKELINKSVCDMRILMLAVIIPYFVLLALKQVNK